MLSLTPGQPIQYLSGQRFATGTVIAEAPKEIKKMYDRPGKRPNYPYRVWLIRPDAKRRPCDPDTIKVREKHIRTS